MVLWCEIFHDFFGQFMRHDRIDQNTILLLFVFQLFLDLYNPQNTLKIFSVIFKDWKRGSQYYIINNCINILNLVGQQKILVDLVTVLHTNHMIRHQKNNFGKNETCRNRFALYWVFKPKKLFSVFFTSRKMNEKFKNNRVEKAQNQEVKHGYPNTGIKQQRYCHMNNPRC